MGIVFFATLVFSHIILTKLTRLSATQAKNPADSGSNLFQLPEHATSQSRSPWPTACNDGMLEQPWQ